MLAFLSLLLTTAAYANNGRSPNAGGLHACQASLAACEVELGVCYEDYDAISEALAACEEAPSGGDGRISPTLGGLAIASDGNAWISVPPGGVVKDTQIKIREVARPIVDTPHRASGVYDFSPDGLTFGTDATLCMAAKVPEGHRTCLGFIDENTVPPVWRCQDECLTQVSPSFWCGKTDHFTNFAVLLRGNKATGSCDAPGEALVSAVTGGTVVSADQKALISVPPGALRADTTIRIAPVKTPPESSQILSDVYDFGPDGLTFRTPATICIESDSAIAPGACLGYFDDKKRTWVCESRLEDRRNNEYCGQTDHFTLFAILLSGKAGSDHILHGDATTESRTDARFEGRGGTTTPSGRGQPTDPR